ncbi:MULTISPECIES: hypothetical protein [Clostridia]|uniref:Uncharacterized protein n=1 Tax=Lacrimispora celerecrescens TaxID=29354 RepID=A0A084JS62_9FIRM|nr:MULTISPECIES: hypothetical protein [Clostridia]KEZ91796.1 hypothetical protein IO98_01050 [Lacrimispora celerecrescens]MSS09154.1 hypothetical protein [Clostridium sp. WB02_MRS01]
MKKTWEVDCDGVRHTVEYRAGFGTKVIVDGQPNKVKSSNWFINMIDYAFSFGDTQCHLTVIGTKTDLAVNGVFQGSGEPYEPLGRTPSWVYVMLAINIIGPFIFGGGIFGALVGVIFGTKYTQSALRKKTGVAIGVFIGCVVIQILLAFFVVGAYIAFLN